MKLYVCKECKGLALSVSDDEKNFSCCSVPMEEVVANVTDASKEKHIPVYSIEDNMINIKVGEITHPMTDDHYISFIALVSDDEYLIKKLKPKDEPVASFKYNKKYKTIYAYCNLHSLFKNEIR